MVAKIQPRDLAASLAEHDYNAGQLRLMVTTIQNKLADTEKARIEEAHKEATALAEKYGLSLGQVFFKGKGGGAKGRKLPIKYENPDNTSETWTGQGNPPNWITESGKSPMEFVLPEYKDEQEKRWKRAEEEKAKKKAA